MATASPGKIVRTRELDHQLLDPTTFSTLGLVARSNCSFFTDEFNFVPSARARRTQDQKTCADYIAGVYKTTGNCG